MNKNCHAAVAVLALALGGCELKQNGAVSDEGATADKDRKKIERLCSSDRTYSRLKEYAFDEARRVGNRETGALDQIAANSVIRMEQPLVRTHDDRLDITVCEGRMIIELPPGTVSAFNGQRRLAADVEYSAQPAADGSGLVYNVTGAERIIYSLAAFNLVDRTEAVATAPGAPADDSRAAAMADQAEREAAARNAKRAAAAETGDVVPSPRPPAQKPVAVAKAAEPVPPPSLRQAEPAAARQAAGEEARALPIRPSFPCRFARTAGEKMVCSSPDLARLDRQMAAIFYDTLADVGPRAKDELRQSRDAFLARRDRCGEPRCVTRVYQDRIDEIRAIGSD